MTEHHLRHDIAPDNQRSPLREQFGPFFTALSDEHIDVALSAAFDDGEEWNQIQLRTSEVLHSLSLNYDLLKRESPAWMHLPHLITEPDMLNSPKLWESLLSVSQAKGVPIVENLEKMMVLEDSSDPSDATVRIAKKIALNNTSFYELQTMYYFLAAGLGRNLLRTNKSPRNNDDYAQQKAVPGGKRIIEMFDEPADSFETLLSRLRRLYPPQINEKDSSSAYFLLRRSKAFTQSDVESSTHTSCPATAFTKRIYEGYGRLLEDPSYQKAFKGRISRQSWTAYMLGGNIVSFK